MFQEAGSRCCQYFKVLGLSTGTASLLPYYVDGGGVTDPEEGREGDMGPVFHWEKCQFVAIFNTPRQFLIVVSAL